MHGSLQLWAQAKQQLVHALRALPLELRRWPAAALTLFRAAGVGLAAAVSACTCTTCSAAAMGLSVKGTTELWVWESMGALDRDPRP